MIFGTRPEAIKMAPLFNELKNKKNLLDVKICITAQHRHLLDQVIKFFNIKVDFDLNIMKESQELSNLTSSIILKVTKVLKTYKPDLVLVHGDTTTTLSAALSAFYLGIKVGHVEAGLRTLDIDRPFPEELNRQLVSKISRWHFSPTKSSSRNLIKENIPSSNILLTGNTVIDSLNLGLKKIKDNKTLRNKIKKSLDNFLPFNFLEEKFIIITGHRRENFGKGFENIFSAILDLSREFRHFHFVYPLHLNPKVKVPALKKLNKPKNIHLIPPLNYPEFIFLLNKCYLVISDSGGIQEEAPSLGKPVLVTRDITERPEALKSGTVKLVGADKIKIKNITSELITNKKLYKSMSRATNPYGDGKAVQRISKFLIKNL